MEYLIEKNCAKVSREHGLCILKDTSGHSPVNFFHLWWALFFGITLPGMHTQAEHSSTRQLYGLFPTHNFNLLWFQGACTNLPSKEFRYLVSFPNPFCQWSGLMWDEGVFCRSCCFPEWWAGLKLAKYPLQVNTALQEFSISTIYQKTSSFFKYFL